MRWMCGLVVIAILGCGGGGGSTEPDAGGRSSAGGQAALMEGSWVDGGGATYTFDRSGSCLRVVDTDGEVFTVTEPGPVNGAVQWVYQVPSTGYVVTHTLKSIDGDSMVAVWANSSGGTGDENFSRAR